MMTTENTDRPDSTNDLFLQWWKSQSLDGEPERTRLIAKVAFRAGVLSRASVAAPQGDALRQTWNGIWPLSDVLTRLADAVDHLLQDHNCDMHGYEQVSFAVVAARWFAGVAAASPVSPSPTPEQKPRTCVKCCHDGEYLDKGGRCWAIKGNDHCLCKCEFAAPPSTQPSAVAAEIPRTTYKNKRQLSDNERFKLNSALNDYLFNNCDHEHDGYPNHLACRWCALEIIAAISFPSVQPVEEQNAAATADSDALLTDDDAVLTAHAIRVAREVQEFIWADCYPALRPYDADGWRRLFQKRVDCVAEVDLTRHGGLAALRKRLLQQAALSIKALALVNRWAKHRPPPLSMGGDGEDLRSDSVGEEGK